MRHIRSRLTCERGGNAVAVFGLGGGTALASYVISSNSQVGPGTISGHQPPAGDHANAVNGSINTQDVATNSLGGVDINEASLTGNARKLSYSAAAASGVPNPQPIAVVGPYIIKAACTITAGGGPTDLAVSVNGPAGTAHVMQSVTSNDSSTAFNSSNDHALAANQDDGIFAALATPGTYTREGGTVMINSDPDSCSSLTMPLPTIARPGAASSTAAERRQPSPKRPGWGSRRCHRKAWTLCGARSKHGTGAT